MAAFQTFFHENSERWKNRFAYSEAWPQLLLQAFLQRALNGGGRVEREFGLGRGRTDLLIVWPKGGDERKFVVECKTLRGSMEATVATGLEQVAGYMDRCAAETGHLVIFDRDEKKPWGEKVFRSRKGACFACRAGVPDRRSSRKLRRQPGASLWIRSGEISGLAPFWAEVREVAAELKPETVALLQVDAAVQDTAIYSHGDLPERIKGRGGTDFRPGFAWLSEQGLRPSCCLYLTDMECDRYPEAEPGYPVVWCNWGPLPGERNLQPWGERIDIQP